MARKKFQQRRPTSIVFEQSEYDWLEKEALTQSEEFGVQVAVNDVIRKLVQKEIRRRKEEQKD